MTHHFYDLPDKEIETLAEELKRLPLLYAPILQEESVRRKVKAMERWAESYRRGAASASILSETGAAWFADLRDRLTQATEEMQQKKPHIPVPPEKEKIEALRTIVLHINHLLNCYYLHPPLHKRPHA